MIFSLSVPDCRSILPLLLVLLLLQLGACAPEPAGPPSIRITIDKESKIYINDALVAEGEILQGLNEAIGANKKQGYNPEATPVEIRVANEAKMRVVTEVGEALKATELKKITFFVPEGV